MRPFGEGPGGESWSPTQNIPREPPGAWVRAAVTSAPWPRTCPPQRLGFHLQELLLRALGAVHSPGRCTPRGRRVGGSALTAAPSTQAQGGKQMLVRRTEIFTETAHFPLCMQADESNDTNDSLELLNQLTLLCKGQQASQVQKSQSSKTSLHPERKGPSICF